MPDPTHLPDPTAPTAADATPAAPEPESGGAVDAQPAGQVVAEPVAGEAAATPAEAADMPAEVASSPAPAATTPAPAAGLSAEAAPEPAGPAPAAAEAAPALPFLQPAACAALLRGHFPALFGGPARPLKLRVQQDIQQRVPGVFSKATLSAFFRRHTTSTSYLLALSKATQRFDLDGQPAGELSEEHRQLALAELARRRQVTREREQQAQAEQRAQQTEQHREQQREAQRARQAEMAQQAAQQQERQARLALLRDFQRTTLTLANFCALKGMRPDELTPLLEQAKKEAAEAPPLPTMRSADDRRAPGQRPPEARRGDRRPDERRGADAPRGPDGPRGPRGPQGPRGPGGPGTPRGPQVKGPRGPAGQS